MITPPLSALVITAYICPATMFAQTTGTVDSTAYNRFIKLDILGLTYQAVRDPYVSP